MSKVQDMKSSSFNDGEWVLVSQTTNAKVTRSYKDKDGNQVSEDNKYKGTPKEVRHEVAARTPQEAVELQYAHTWSTYVFEEHNNDNHGVTKTHMEKEIQQNGFGTNAPSRTSSLPQSERLDYNNGGKEEGQPMDPFPSEPGNEHKTRTLKNMIDKHFDLSLVILGVAVIGIIIAVIALVK